MHRIITFKEKKKKRIKTSNIDLAFPRHWNYETNSLDRPISYFPSAIIKSSRVLSTKSISISI